MNLNHVRMTVLVITKGFKNNETIKNICQSIYNRCEKKW